ncbi:MAG: DUF3578 domain-containing protein [Odoribacter sp.]|nr:DUF3578 domain-containing protein [Odoribacter sp.]
MPIPDNITREHILKAIQQINERGIPNHYQSSTYDLICDGLRYPPKLVFSYANYFANGVKLSHKEFHGGADTECFTILKSNGFEIVSKEMNLAIDLDHFLKQAQTNNLKTQFYAGKYQGLAVKISFGQGGIAKIPWISFLGLGQTTSKGIYPVYLFYKEYHKLILAYGISETNKPVQYWKISNSMETIDTYFSKTGVVPQRYGQSYVFKVYDTSTTLDYVSMEDDLRQIIQEYKQLMGATPMEKTESINFSIDVLSRDLQQTGLLFEDRLLNRFVTALLAKPFVILTGLAGSGKTKLAQEFAQWICEKAEQMCIVPVGADWTNREALLGYPNALNEGEYVLPENGVLNLLIEANKPENAGKPYFLILDEMNLSHVERYFADFLSVMESQDRIPLHPETEIWKGCKVPGKVGLPANLFIVGTVNIDETTYMFSPKVLDRANVIEFRVTSEEMKRFLEHKTPIDLNNIRGKGAGMGKAFVEMAKNKKWESKENKNLTSTLFDFFNKLKKVGAEFGYRTASEIYAFVAIANQLVPDWPENAVIDAVIMQKLLPKLHGSQRKLESALRTLGELCLNEGQDIEDYFIKDNPIEQVKYPLSLDKLVRMYKGVVNNGFVSYAEA